MMQNQQAAAPISIPALFKWAGAMVASIWVGMPVAVHLLLAAMALDYFSGLIAAAIARELSSEVALKGVLKKTLLLILLLAAHVIELAAGVDVHLLRGVSSVNSSA